MSSEVDKRVFWTYNILWSGIGIMWGSALTDALPNHADKIWFTGAALFLFCTSLILTMVMKYE